MKRVAPPLALLAAAVGLWELVVWAANVPDYLFPSPVSVASSLSNTTAWQRVGTWMHTTSLLKKAIPAASVVDATFLPPRCR